MLALEVETVTILRRDGGKHLHRDPPVGLRISASKEGDSAFAGSTIQPARQLAGLISGR